MNVTPQESPDVPTTPPSSPRSTIQARIREARMPQVTKKFGLRILEKNATVGTTFYLSMKDLSVMRHAATNLDVVKCLRRLRSANLLTYTIDHQSSKVTLKFNP